MEPASNCLRKCTLRHPNATLKRPNPPLRCHCAATAPPLRCICVASLPPLHSSWVASAAAVLPLRSHHCAATALLLRCHCNALAPPSFRSHFCIPPLVPMPHIMALQKAVIAQYPLSRPLRRPCPLHALSQNPLQAILPWHAMAEHPFC